MNVVLADNNSSNLVAAKSAIKGRVETVEMDVSKLQDFEKLKEKVTQDFGGMPSSVFPLHSLSPSLQTPKPRPVHPRIHMHMD